MGESILHVHAQRTVIYGVVIVSRNLERTNENDGFKMTALEHEMIWDEVREGHLKANQISFSVT